MAIVAYFETDFTKQQYDQVLSGLAAKGLQVPCRHPPLYRSFFSLWLWSRCGSHRLQQ